MNKGTSQRKLTKIVKSIYRNSFGSIGVASLWGSGKCIDYFTGGMQMPGRTWVSSGYRYGHNGQEKDDEVKGNGNSLDYSDRTYDPRIGRFSSVDPHRSKYPSISPYSAFYNNPLVFTDPNGRDNIIYLVVFPGSRPDINVTDAANSLQLAVNNIVGEHRVNVVVLSPEEFDKSKFDPSDAVVAFGNISQIQSFQEKNFPNGESKDVVYNLRTGDPENADYTNNFAGINNDRLAGSSGASAANPKAFSTKAPGMSAQDEFVLYALHAVTHMVGEYENAGHANKPGKQFHTNEFGGWFTYNYMMDGDDIRNTIAKIDAERNAFEQNLKSYRDFYSAFYNSYVFKSIFNAGFNSFPFNDMKGIGAGGSSEPSKLTSKFGKSETYQKRSNSSYTNKTKTK